MSTAVSQPEVIRTPEFSSGACGRPLVKTSMKETLLTPRFYTTDFDAMEAMFKDCKTGGDNLEGSSASIKRLTNLVLLIAIAYTLSPLKGQSLLRKGQKE